MFHQRIEGLGLSIEEGTDAVPHDGRYYVRQGGSNDRSYRTLREATRRYLALKTALADRASEGGAA
ncbi:MAG: hypothetical protein EXR68_00540 [Dehalococcoidia bacterium]|nr:hypothetical protein [Dehalococcoidia bacterium]